MTNYAIILAFFHLANLPNAFVRMLLIPITFISHHPIELSSAAFETFSCPNLLSSERTSPRHNDLGASFRNLDAKYRMF